MTEEAAFAPSAHWQEAIIVSLLRRTERVISVFLRVPLAPRLAGQHVDVRLTAPDGYQAQRSYSIASAPGSEEVELAIERLEGGEVSPYFHDVAQPGDAIEVRGPIGGHFVWHAADGGPTLLVAGGSGIVPLMAIIRDWSVTRSGSSILLVYSARSWEELVFRDELLDTQARQPHLSFIATTTRGPRRRPDDFERRVDRALLHGVLTRWNHAARSVYVCGSNAFVETVAASLVLEATPPERIRTERFGGQN